MGVRGGLVGRDTEKKARMVSLEILLVFALAVCGLLGVAYIGFQMAGERGNDSQLFEQQLDTLSGPSF